MTASFVVQENGLQQVFFSLQMAYTLASATSIKYLQLNQAENVCIAIGAKNLQLISIQRVKKRECKKKKKKMKATDVTGS